MWRKFFRLAIASQQYLSALLDLLLPAALRLDGNHDFQDSFVPQYLRPNLTVYDIGGGKQPYLGPEIKTQLSLSVIGLDIDAQELARAPSGCYDQVICTDICRYQGRHDADLVICQALLEHVPDTRAAIQGIASILKPGGVALIFVPSRHAAFALLNRLLPQGLKRKLLFAVFPDKSQAHGFPSFYDHCTPGELVQFGQACGLQIAQQRNYYASGYFSCCFPLHLLWRIWIIGCYCFWHKQGAETFSLSLCNSAVALHECDRREGVDAQVAAVRAESVLHITTP